ncbi:MAG: acyltransferase [Rubrivivax sp.]
MGALPAPLRGTLALLLLVINTLACSLPLLALALLRLLLAVDVLRVRLDPLLDALARTWVSGNSVWMRWTQPTEWRVNALDGLTPRDWVLVVANHQSWVDIFVLQHLLNGRVPLLKFFLKRELLYVPVMGLAWWALGFPFMRRHSEEELRRDPAKREQDLREAERACARFAQAPSAVMNFVEGTRFTEAKRGAGKGRFVHLLQPKAGGLAVAVAVLGARCKALVDATIVYEAGAPSFWQFLCGRVPRITVELQALPLPPEMQRGDGHLDPALRRQVQRWLLELWQAKDERIAALKGTLKSVPRTADSPGSGPAG